MSVFTLQSAFKPAGDQPQAIQALSEGLNKGMRHQTLLGVTGSGKTYTSANVVAAYGKPTLVIAHNKTLAAQLAQEYREFFPDHAVHYFVSYYDYYQPEAYIAASDTYIEKEAQINDEIDRLRHASTQALLTRRDVIIVASVSCIYGLGSPKEYLDVNLKVSAGEYVGRQHVMRRLVGIFFARTNADLAPGTFRAVGGAVEVMPAGANDIYRIEFHGEKISRIERIDAVSREHRGAVRNLFIFPAKHFVTPEDERNRAIAEIKEELKERLRYFRRKGTFLEAERLKRRTNYDIAMIREVGYTNGIENYSRHLSGRKAGEPPDTLLSYFPKRADGVSDFLTVIDESHVTIPQIRGMYEGDASRKRTLIEHGFRLPSAEDNRPLKFREFEERIGRVLYTSATPGPYELEKSREEGQVVEQIVRPTGLVDPALEVRPIVEREGRVAGSAKRGMGASLGLQAEAYKGQVKDLIAEVEKNTAAGERSIATTLTKKMAEDLAEFLKERGVRAEYLHSEIKTLERIKILTEFRKGTFDCLVGVNLLREGLDLPEVSFIGILDADKEGFLRSETSLIQTIGRAARNVRGRVVLYAEHVTDSMRRAMDETERRRRTQIAFNKKNGVTPQSIKKKIHDITDTLESRHERTVKEMLTLDRDRFRKNPKALIREKEKQMSDAVKVLDFETAALLRDEIRALEEMKRGTRPSS